MADKTTSTADEHRSDEEGVVRVSTILSTTASSACRLCGWRNRIDELMFFVRCEPPAGKTAVAFGYCPPCWSYIQQHADGCLDALPRLPVRDKWITVQLPAFQIKGDDPLKLFWPEPEIDRPLWLKRLKELRSKS